MTDSVKSYSLVAVTAIVLIFSYLFYVSDGIPLALALLFVGIVLALTIASDSNSKKNRK